MSPATLTLAPEVLADPTTRAALDALAADTAGPVEIVEGPLRDVLRHLARRLRDNAGVLVAPADATYTPAQVAKVLGVSRSYVSRLIRAGRIAATKVGTHHRVSGAEVARAVRRRAALEEVLELGAELEDALEVNAEPC